MKPAKQLLITFDYELFLGNRSGNIDECLITPTDAVLSIIEKHGAKAIFFVDTTYLLTLQKYAVKFEACKTDFERVSNHVASLVQRGHYVFPHLHPHWLDAIYLQATNEWQLTSTAKYRFFHLNNVEKAEVFDQSIQVLETIIKPVHPTYKIDGYRAGGWCIQPFSDFSPYFKKHNITYDFSVLGGFYLFSNAQYFDFSETPKKNRYRFQEKVEVEEDDGDFTQFNISSIFLSKNIQLLNKIFLKLYSKFTGDHSFNRGQGQIAVKLDPELIHPVTSGHDILDSQWQRVAIELLTAVTYRPYLSYFKQHDYMHFISHPKMLTGHNIKMFGQFLATVFKDFNVETDFRKIL